MKTDQKYLRPPFILSKIINPLIVALRLVPILTVKGRTTGRWINVPVTPLEYKNETYLVAPRGETQWARNLRINANARLTIKGKVREFKTTEVSGTLQKEVVQEYQTKVPAVKSQFLSLPDPKDHPTFRLNFTN
ncbi:MAG TPA: nitroreductase/quinone reductase family protein [Candidatus Saccharimonadales bacterium]|nr:nitroreductase/quinone reductase family protein [Candidatus Saccharimonadales bacterium]